jgi:hypothetical protein
MDIFDVFKVIKWMASPLSRLFKNMFRDATGIFGPSKSGKTTFHKVLQGKPYFIGEYNHTSSIMVCDKQNIKYTSLDNQIDPIRMKIKHDVPGEDFNAWRELILSDKPKSIILILDLVGLIKDGKLDVASETIFNNVECKDNLGNIFVQETTAKEKFQEQLDSFKTIWETYKAKNMKLIGMTVFLNKCDIWLKEGVDDLGIRYLYKNEIKERLNLTTFAKDLKMEHDICFEVTSMLPELHRKYLEPAILRHASMTKK